MIPLMPGVPASDSISRTDSSTSWMIGHERHTGPPHRVGGAELDQPAVVGPRAGERQGGVGDLAGGETRRRTVATPGR